MSPGKRCLPSRSMTVAPRGAAPGPMRSMRSPRIRTSAAKVRPSLTSCALTSCKSLMPLLSPLQEALRGADELGHDPGLVARVPRVDDDAEVGLGPAPVQLPRRGDRANDIVAP